MHIGSQRRLAPPLSTQERNALPVHLERTPVQDKQSSLMQQGCQCGAEKTDAQEDAIGPRLCGDNNLPAAPDSEFTNTIVGELNIVKTGPVIPVYNIRFKSIDPISSYNHIRSG
jgi:hypothetical protein